MLTAAGAAIAFVAGLLIVTFESRLPAARNTTTTGPTAVGAGSPVVFLADRHALSAAKTLYRSGDPRTSAAVTALLSRANRDLSVAPVSVTSKTQVPPSGSKHDYMSLSIYAWPDPSKPDGLPYIVRDGHKNPAAGSIGDKVDLVDVIDWSQELAYAYYFSGDNAYAAKAATILETWFLDPLTRMDPNLDYAQAVKGKSSGQAGGIIDAADLPKVVDAVDLLAGAPAWPARDNAGMRSWFSSLLSWLRTSPAGKAEGAAKNNHATWYYDQVLSYALFEGNNSLATELATRAESRIVASQISASGAQPEELARTDSWSYSTYNVEALGRLAELSEYAHVDLWNYRAADGASIRAALNFVARYTTRPASWPYPQSGTRTLQYLVIPLYEAAEAYSDGAYAQTAQSAAAQLSASYPAPTILFADPG